MQLPLEAHHIVDLYVWVDDALPKSLPSASGGRPPALRDSELVTLLIWNTLVLHQKNLKDLWRFGRIHLHADFPKIPSYPAFVDHCHRVTPLMFSLLQCVLCADAPIKFADSTMLEVCRLKRADQHRVAKKIAAFGKNHQGWHYGFKLHASTNLHRQLCALVLTPANIHDGQVSPRILNKHTRIGVGDSHYGGRVMLEHLWESQKTIVITPPHYTQRKKISTPWQNQLLSQRSKIEAVFDFLKEHLHLVSSFPRSIFGYLVHYIRILLGYQILALSCAA